MILSETYVSHRPSNDGRNKIIIKFKQIHGIPVLWRWLKKEIFVEYYGASTVWYTFPDFKRVGPFGEGSLLEIYTRLMYEESQKDKINLKLEGKELCARQSQ